MKKLFLVFFPFFLILNMFFIVSMCDAKDSIDLLRVGMTEEEVVAALGPPDSAYNNKQTRRVWTGKYESWGSQETYDETYWIRIYEYLEGIKIGSWRITDDTILRCFFQDGKLYSWTRRPFLKKR